MARPWLAWLKNEALWSLWRRTDRQLAGGCLASGGLVIVLNTVPLTASQQEPLVTLLIMVINYTWYRFAREQGKHIPRDHEKRDSVPPPGDHH